ncbi:MAG TPA: CYTH domain-containing protein [Actinomycetes bacterium]|nr:CYTH domain-containing protein [Actinomycetes bacterium]
MSEHPREVEGVLLVRADDQEAAGDRVAALEVVDRFQLRPLPARRIRDVYIDTDDGALAGSRVAFRLREQDGRPLLTLKADAVRSGLASERLELEAPWSADALRVALEELARRGVELPTPAEVGEPLADLAALGLHPTQTRETTRVPRDVVERDAPGAGPVAELTLDDVAYQLPAGTARLIEVEVEAKGSGGVETVQSVLGALAERFPDDLRPWPYGKLATGRAVEQLLADGRLEGLLDSDGRIRPAAHNLLAEFLSENSP